LEVVVGEKKYYSSQMVTRVGDLFTCELELQQSRHHMQFSS